jgi:AmiR/NasT family two-component response regulator
MHFVMSSRAQHLAEMRVAVERRCSLAEAKAYLARTKRWAGEEALRKVRGEDRPAKVTPAAQQEETQSRFWWKEN